MQIEQMLNDQLSEPFDPEQYKGEYGAALSKASKQKLSGQSVDVIDIPTPRANVLDLMARATSDLDATKSPKKPGDKKKKSKATGNVS